jgi:hypothetical protein
MNILANATDQTSTGQIRGRHYIAFQISNTEVMKLGRQKHSKQLFIQSFFCLCRGTWVSDRRSLNMGSSQQDSEQLYLRAASAMPEPSINS